jgi:exosome complex exonuclease RRP6
LAVGTFAWKNSGLVSYFSALERITSLASSKVCLALQVVVRKYLDFFLPELFRMDDQYHDEERASSGMEDEVPVDDAELFSELVAALAVGARAVAGLPLVDEFEYQSSFPEFRQLLSESKDGLVDAIILALDDYASTDSSNNNSSSSHMAAVLDETHLDDPLLWETCADACDALLEQVEAHLRNADIADTTNNLSQWSDTARRQAQSSFGRLLEGIVEMEKPQSMHQLFEEDENNDRNDRRTPFVPKITEKYHAITPLTLTLKLGHGLESRFGELRSTKAALAPNLVAPKHHVPHVYETEIQSLEYTEEQLEAPSEKPAKIEIIDTLQSTWVDTPQALQELGALLSQSSKDDESGSGFTEIALDLEAHSYRTFAGLTCLIQLSFQSSTGEIQNFLIDPFPLWKDLAATLGPILANPRIVKILHGADSDVQWLQRDFGLYIVNLFDTGRAARALQFSSAGYAYLLQHYAGITPDKTHQLSDWRQRPLPDAMKQYATMDTHYLLSIYHHLKFDIAQRHKKHKDAPTIKDVFDTSKLVSLIRYAPEPFRPDGYKSLISSNSGQSKRRGTSRGYKNELNVSQEAVLRSLFDWRDETARICDESVPYVCSNQALVRLALSCPNNLASLQGLLNPMPPMVLRSTKEILGVIQDALRHPDTAAGLLTPSSKTKASPVGAPSSAFFRPAKSQEEETPRDRLLSPVLGTEALYMQAGWITPQDERLRGPDAPVEVVTTTSEDDDGGEESEMGGRPKTVKPRHGLSVHNANQKFRSNQFTPHSLQLGGRGDDDMYETKTRSLAERGKVDGMGSARAARNHSQSPVPTRPIEDEAALAQKSASLIRTTMSQEEQHLLGLISTDADMDDEDDGGDDGDDRDGDGESRKDDGNDDEDFVIPRSMREIYRISNRNRRNKKAGSPVLNERGNPMNEKELDALAKAEEVLKARGLDGRHFFDDMPSDGPKRQRTKSTGTASTSSEEAGGHDSGNLSREDDIQLMQEIGWIKDKEEVDGMLNQRRASVEADDVAHLETGGEEDSEEEEAATATSDKAAKPTFDYSSIGPIGAFNPTAPSPTNPFFAGAAIAGGYLNQQPAAGKPENKKKPTAAGRGKPATRRQVERPEKRNDRAQTYKKR